MIIFNEGHYNNYADEDWGSDELDGYSLIRTKQVCDSDGFMTDYAMYYDYTNDKYICIFGDIDLYNPENTEPDFECDTEAEANEWFRSYEGYSEEDIDWFNDGYLNDFDDLDESIIKLTINEKISENDYSQSKKGKAYKVFQFKNGKLYPPMVANTGGQSTPVNVWLDAEPGEFIELDGMRRVIQIGRNKESLLQILSELDNATESERKDKIKKLMGATLAYRPGWHLGDEPRAAQFDRNFSWEIVDELPDDAEVAKTKRKVKGAETEVNVVADDIKSIPNFATAKNLDKYIPIKSTGQYAHIFGDTNYKQFFPYNFVWAECDYIMDVDYQEEAHQTGTNERQVTYKLMDGTTLDDNDNEYQIIQFKQGDNIFNVTFNSVNDIRIDGYPFEDLENNFNAKDYVQKEVQNYFLKDNMNIIKNIIRSNSKRGKETMKVFSHRSGDLKHLPTNGYYKYRTNPNPDTVPWVITSAIKVNKLLDDYDVEQLLGGNAPERQGGNKSLEELGLTQI